MVVLVVLVIIVPIVMIIVVKDLDVLDLYAKTQGLYQVSGLSYGPCNENFGKTALSPHGAMKRAETQKKRAETQKGQYMQKEQKHK